MTRASVPRSSLAVADAKSFVNVLHNFRKTVELCA